MSRKIILDPDKELILLRLKLLLASFDRKLIYHFKLKKKNLQ